MSYRSIAICLSVVVLSATTLTTAATLRYLDEYKSGVIWPEPPVVDPGGPEQAPSDAVVLFDGTDLSAWVNGDKWLIEDGVATVQNGSIRTKEAYHLSHQLVEAIDDT